MAHAKELMELFSNIPLLILDDLACVNLPPTAAEDLLRDGSWPHLPKGTSYLLLDEQDGSYGNGWRMDQ
jgi:hypothetical protein